ncbi:LamG domain-containing protein [Candidatus Roizmanbacteria bacterium]|nr:LamG domain-containing protein [Candidatus Roizmanbacteria bacterium]
MNRNYIAIGKGEVPPLIAWLAIGIAALLTLGITILASILIKTPISVHRARAVGPMAYGVDHVIYDNRQFDLLTTGVWAQYVHDDRDSFMLVRANEASSWITPEDITVLNNWAKNLRTVYPRAEIFAATSGLQNAQSITNGINSDLFDGIMYIYEPTHTTNTPEFSWDHTITEKNMQLAATAIRGVGLDAWGKPTGRALAGRDKADEQNVMNYGFLGLVLDGQNVQTQGSCMDKNGNGSSLDEFQLAIDDLVSQFKATGATSRIFAQVTVASNQINQSSPYDAIECSKYAWAKKEIQRMTLWSAVGTQQLIDEATDYLMRREVLIASAPPPGPVGHWKFDEGSGDTISDSSGNNTTGALNGATWDAGKVGSNALQFDGVDDYVDMGSSLNMGRGDITVAAWVKTPSSFWTNGTYRVVAGKASTVAYSTINNSDGWAFLFGNNGRLSFALPGVSPSNSAGASFAPNTWYHVASSYDASLDTVTFYVDGLPLGSPVSMTDVGNLNNMNSFVIGREADGGRAINAVIDDVRVYNRVLSSSEVSDLANPLPVGHYRFDESSGQIVSDSSPSENDGTRGAFFSSELDDPISVEGKIGGALDFDGVDDYVNIPRNIAIEPSGAITVAAWVKWDNPASSNFGKVVTKSNITNDAPFYSYEISQGGIAGAMRFSININGVNYKTGDVSIPLISWHHVAGTWSLASQTLRFYLDGKEVPAASKPGLPMGTITYFDTPLTIGASGNTQANTWFDGKIDDVRIYNSELSPQEISDLVNPAIPSPTLTPTPTPTKTPIPTPTPIPPLQITNIIVASGKIYTVGYNSLVSGALVYTDRTYTYTSYIPATLLGKTYIKTANNDKYDKKSDFLSFNVNRNVKVYVAYDARAKSLPTWLSSWTNENEFIGTTDVSHDLYSKTFPAGTIILGGNLAPEANGAESTYTVIVAEN